MKKRFESNSAIETTLTLGLTFLTLLLGGLFGYFLVQDISRSGHFPPESKVCGIDVSGLTRREATERCREELKEVAEKPVVLTLDGAEYPSAAESLGLSLDYHDMVANAYDQAWRPMILERMFRSFTNRPLEVDSLLAVDHDEQLVNEFIANVTAAVNAPPQNAYVDVTSGAPVIVPARNGYQAEEAEIREYVSMAINSKTRTVEIEAASSPALLADDAFGRLIIVNLSEHKLYLYDRESLVAEYGVANGTASYPTPAGQFKIVSKQSNPSWYNPGSAWASGMPKSIGPGYNNPLGLRAMALNASGILIHGTAAAYSIGTAASHGCIRMRMNDVIALFDQVQTATPVYIIKGAGNPGFDVTATPSWRLADYEVTKAAASNAAGSR